ncbi:MAG TPA: protease pro-enzyme activation domain-containing protein [Terriglobales bacterium]|nr:protease pro-enzyme activation domain-containing protein [Terriglobales bacterium]
MSSSPIPSPISASPRLRFPVSLILGTALLWMLAPATLPGQTSATTASTQPGLITQPIDEAQLTVLKGNTHPLARPQFDLGTAPATLPMARMLLVLKRSLAQEAALRKLLDDQQDKHSPSYHKWLTPEQFGQQFGPTDSDMATISSWLQSHGFQVGSTKGRTVLEFSGSASQVQEAFHTTIHKYLVKGEQHWANATDPMIPTALTPAVAGVLTLHNFIKKPTIHFTGEPIPAKLVPGRKKPQVTFPPEDGQPAINALAPQDYAVIYDINPLYNVDNDGNGTSIAVVGRSDPYNGGQDVENFYQTIGSGNNFNTPDFNIVLDGPDPGDLGGGEEAEATLDSTWSGAIAPGANVNLVVSATTNTTDGIDLSENYIIENNLADIMTESFSSCELYATDAQLAGASAMAEQAAAQGITYFVSTGDDGAEGCDDPNFPPATNPISVNYLASTAFNVAVGGTMFNENGDPSKYWTSTPPISETAISYIPEDVWNESSLTNGLWSGSGGASAGNIQSGVGTTPGVPKPYWQSGLSSIPDDGVRDLPDVSLTAAGHDPYLLCLEGSCVPNSQGEIFVYFISGTSASAPSFAGIMALIDQGASGQRQGLANYILYRLAATQSAYPSQCDGSNTSTPPASTCVFNDVTVGNNVVPGEVGTDYQAGVGYDMTTGLGSVNVANLQNQWDTVTFNPTTTTIVSMSPITITHGQSTNFDIAVTGTSGTPTGYVSVLATDVVGGQRSAGTFPLSQGSFVGPIVLPGPIYPGLEWISVQYSGDETFAPSVGSSSNPITMNAESSTTTVSVLTANQTGQAIPFTSGPFGSFVYLRADIAGVSGYGVPTGTVTFTDTFGAIPGGNLFTLNSEGNTANPNGVFTFDTGTHTISATYSGDPSFNPSSSTQSQTFTITPGFFASVASSQSTVVISSPGVSGQSSVSVSNSTNFNGTISLSCSGLPTEASCTFSPSSITANGTPNTVTAAISVSTTAVTTAADRQSRLLSQLMIGLGLFGSFLFGGKRKRRGHALMLVLLLALIVPFPGCGGGSSTPPGPPPNPGTPTGTYNVTVSAVSGSTVSTTGFTLVVQ